ncbi:phosphocholine-specific phospholipase C [Rubrolithibacter danxiaensis]|uniref:phosphocholine-specific phospholipase C n=1 Tax=Rubrolithibacter danxiaensis TaxID=3390805 RepID=UPI003BF84C0A
MSQTESRREFIKKATLLTGAAGIFGVLPPSIHKALAIEAEPGTTWLDAEHIVFLMQENRSFDHCYGTLRGVRGFNDPRAIKLPNKNKVWLQTNKAGETFAPFRLDIKNSSATWMGSLPHSWSDQVDARNHGRFDTWLEAKKAGNPDYAHMPLTLGYYDRKDIPFYYALADAFTVCDQYFCSSLTGTSPNRSYFWSGTVRENSRDENSKAHVWNGEIDYKDINWTTFPEQLEKAGISWKVYQNELSLPVGFEDEEEAWLANFTDNSLEFFKQYNVRLHPAYLDYLDRSIKALPSQIKKLEEQLKLEPENKKVSDELEKRKNEFQQVSEARKKFTREKFNSLSDFEKSIHKKAFTTNATDAHYHQLSTITYEDQEKKRMVKVPKGDVFHQFRADADKNELPTVSWLVAPANFSDHPGAPWYGAWYVSEALDILTKNPEVWKKTIFILTYDENDGYFDHVPPFVPPLSSRPYTGAVSSGIDTSAEWVSMEQEKARENEPEDHRESPIGLGYRVPLVIASPWSRGGWVNSEVFDHTSCLQFLEKFITEKTGKQVHEANITPWRRTVCGNLTSVFRPFNNEPIHYPDFLKRNEVIEDIYEARFKALPGNFKVLTDDEIKQINLNPASSALFPSQEPGIRNACAIPYELYVDAKLDNEKKNLQMNLMSGNELFGKQSAGAAFIVYAPVNYTLQTEEGRLTNTMHNWAFAVKAGDTVPYQWPLEAFEDGKYHLQVYGANGFFREFSGNSNDPELLLLARYEQETASKDKITSNLILQFNNRSKNQAYQVEITDNAYHSDDITVLIPAGKITNKVINLKRSSGWYDLSVKVKGFSVFEKRYAGHVETGRPGISDPFMGRVKI